MMDLNLDQQMKWLGGGAFTLPLASIQACRSRISQGRTIA